MTDIQERVTKFQEFFDLHCKQKIHETIGLGQKSLVVDFRDLVKFDHELAEYLLAQPDDTLKEMAMATEQFDLQQVYPIRVRLINLPQSQKIKIRDIRSEHLGRLIAMEGIVRQASDVRPQVVSAKFECPSCGNLITIPQIEQRFREPFRCSCGKRGRFKVVERDLVDTQRLVVEESPEALEGGEQPKRLSVFLREDLVEPKMEKKTTPGAKILVTAAIKEVAIQFKSGAQSTRYDLVAEANNIEPVEETYEEIEISEEDEIKIKQLAKDPKVYEKFVNSIGTSIFGHESIKGALVLQLMGGVKKERSDGTATKGDIHILLVGDPGSAKTSLLMFMSKAAPKSRYVDGRGASAAGLCVAPDSLIATNPGGIHKIQDMVENKLCDNIEKYQEGVWRAKNANDTKKIFTLDDSLNVRTSSISQFWKIQPPECMVRLTTRSGKEVTVTPNTKLFSIEDCNTLWKEAGMLKEGEYLAAPTQLQFQRAFRDNAGFNLGCKREALISHERTNVDGVPGANKVLYKLLKKYNLRRSEIVGGSKMGGYVGASWLSKQTLKRIILRLQTRVDTRDMLYKKLSSLADADVIWEKIVKVEKIHDHGYKFVYDLTVENSHNFVVNGLVVHNTATVVKDEFLRGWALEAGAIVLANGGYLFLDELDKISVEDTSALHEALAQQRVSISKANIQATLKAQTTVLAAANPKFGRFDPYQPIAAQIDLPPTLINRFDLIFPVRDLPSKDKDTKIASHILELQRQTEEKLPEISIEMIKKYVAYARKNLFPKLTDEAVEELKEFYVGLRNMPTVGEEGGVKPIPISARQLEALVRLSEASARVRLSEKVTRTDARNAINILKHCLMQVGFDYETGQIDIDRISTGIPASTRSRIIIIREIISGIDAKGKKSIPIGDIIAEASEKNLKEDQVEEVLEKLKREGEIFEPRRGFISKV